uniref:Uncharacterized protein n=1 Tax=Myotis myotis TaxID=51298 RepID=A0A7J7ZX33_MYOMY|nr:hypothetical protein mMyoMyo1_009752 [Myotis myotis]
MAATRWPCAQRRWGPVAALHSETWGSCGSVRRRGGWSWHLDCLAQRRQVAAGEGTCGPSGQQGMAVGGHQASRGGQLGAIRLGEEQLGINQAGRGVVRGQSGRQAGEWLGASGPTGIGPKPTVRYPPRDPSLERVQAGLRDPPPCTNFVHRASSSKI